MGNVDKMIKDLEKARKFSEKNHCTVWAMSNGEEIIWSNRRSQVEVDGFWICSIFNNGFKLDI